jgi:myosin heavy subunit
MIILAVVAVALGGVLGYMLYQRNSLVKDLETEKAELAQQMVALQQDFDSLNSDYESINHQLDTSREQVALLIEKLSKTEATNRAKIRQYEKELGTLRSIMKGYIVQIDSLNTLNKKLTADAAEARREAAESRRANEQLTAQVENLSSQVNAGKILKARAISLVGYMSNDKPGDRHSRVRYMVANLSLVENSLADRGPVRVYVRVKDPEGLLLINNESTEFMVNGEVLQATASREVDYEGNEVDLSIYINDTGTFNKGVYTLEVYTEKGLLGHAECMLR